MRKASLFAASVVLLCALGGAPAAGQTSAAPLGTTILDDKFANGNSQLQDLANNSVWLFNGRSTTTRTDQPGSVTFDVTGTGGSSEGFWAFFTTSGSPLVLGVGDTLTVSQTFSLQGFLGNGQDIRWGVFDSLGTRNTANLTAGMNDATFVNDPGYGLDFFPSGNGNPFVIGRRAMLGNANVFNNFGDFSTLTGTGATARQALADNTPYTLTFTIQRLTETTTQLTSTVTGGSLSGLTYTATETTATPQTTFDYFAFRIAGTSFTTKISFSELLVKYLPSAPVITSQPQPAGVTVQVGANISITVAGSGSSIGYQWLKNGQAITNNPSAAPATLALTNAQHSDAGTYTAVISNSGGSITSNAVIVNVSDTPVPPAPLITMQPGNTVATLGDAARLSVAATGANLTYQWYKNGAAIAGATSAQLTFASVQVSDSGQYSVNVSNPSGSVASASATLLVVSTVSAVGFGPTASSAVCSDTSLTIQFDQNVALGKSGKIRIDNSAGTVVDTIDLAASPQTRQVGGLPYNYDPVIINGASATVVPHQPLPGNDTYSVTVEPGAFVDAQGAPFSGLTDTTRWTFRTQVPPPPAAGTISVAQDSTGQYCTLQAALDSVPANNTQPVTITMKRGYYNEMIYIPSTKPFLTIRGEDRDGVVIQYADNANFNSGFARSLFGVDASDFTLQDLTVYNLTPKGGSQAEAVRGNNQRLLLNRVNLKSFQDTLWLQGSAMVTHSYIEGDVDFTWGYGAVYYQNDELKALSSNGFYAQIRNDKGQNGNVYVNCWLTSAPSVTGSYLARIDPTTGQFPYSQVIFVNTAMAANIAPVGWLLNNATTAPSVQFWEYNSTDLNGTPLDVTQRAPFSRQLNASEAAQYSDPAFVLSGWVPFTINSDFGTASPGASIPVIWTAPVGHSANDSVGLFAVGAPDSSPVSQQAVGSGTVASGTKGRLVFQMPAQAGTYEFRYIRDGAGAAVTSSNKTVVR